jgi:arginase
MKIFVPFVVVVGVVAVMASVSGHSLEGQAKPLRIALVKQPFIPNGTSIGPTTMAEGGIQAELKKLGAEVRVSEIALTKDQEPEYGGWKRLSTRWVISAAQSPRTTATDSSTSACSARALRCRAWSRACSMPDPVRVPLKVGLLWLDAHPDFNTPETTRSGSLGGMPVAVATGRCLVGMRLDAALDPPLADQHVVMGGVRMTDPLEQALLDKSKIQQLSVDDLRSVSPEVTKQLDRLSKITDIIYVHVDMDVLDPREVAGHQNKVPGGPTSGDLARLFEMIFSKYPKAAAIGFATIPAQDEGGFSIAALNRMILGAVKGLHSRGPS